MAESDGVWRTRQLDVSGATRALYYANVFVDHATQAT